MQAYSAVLAALAAEGPTRDAVATVACADAGGGATDALLSVTLKQLDNATALGGARQVLLQINASTSRYMDLSGPPGSATLGTVTDGSIIATIVAGSLYLVETDATGLFGCTVTNAVDETLYFNVKTPSGGVSDITKRCTVAGSNSDGATWSA